MKHHTLMALSLTVWAGQSALIGVPTLAQSGIETLEDFEYWQNLCDLQTRSGNPEEALPACEQAIALEPEDENAWAAYGYAHLSLEQYPESLAAMNRILTLNEQNSLAMTYQCMAFQGLDMTEAALDACDAALQTNSYWGNQSPVLAWQTRGQILNQMGQSEQALIAYDRALQLEPEDSLTLAYRCQILVEAGEYQYGLSACESALAGNGHWGLENSALALAYKGRAHTGLGQDSEDYESMMANFGKAIAAYDRAVALEPEEPEYWLQQGWLLERTDNFAAAVLSYNRAVELVPDSSRGLVGQCSTLNHQAQYETAKAACEQAIAGDGDWWFLGAAQAWQGMAHAMAGLADYESALAAVDRAVGMRPDYLAAQSDRSVILWYLEDYDKAIETAQLITNINELPQDEENLVVLINTWFNLGRIHSSQESYDDAIGAYNQAINLTNLGSTTTWADLRAETWSNLSAVFWATEQYTQALDAADRATGLNAQLEQGWQNRGAAEAALGYYTAALESYEKARDLNNQNAETWAGLGAVQLRLGESDAAIESLEIAVQLDPHQALARKILEMLEDSP